MTLDSIDWASIVAGSAVGWLAHWGLDALYWRGKARVLDIDTLLTARAESDAKITALETEVEALRAEVQRLVPIEGKTADYLSQISRLDQALLEAESAQQALQAEAAELRARLAQAETAAATPSPAAAPVVEATLAGEPVAVAVGPKADDLTAIEGIDANTQALLHEAGIRTYQDLATCSPDALFAIIRPRRGQIFEPESWVVLAGRKAKEAVTP